MSRVTPTDGSSIAVLASMRTPGGATIPVHTTSTLTTAVPLPLLIVGSGRVFVGPVGDRVTTLTGLSGAVLAAVSARSTAAWSPVDIECVDTDPDDYPYGLVDASAGAVAFTLPQAAGRPVGATFTIQKADASATTITLTPYPGETVNGAGSAVVLSTAGAFARFRAVAGGWVAATNTGGGAVSSVDGQTGAVDLSSTYAPILTPAETITYNADGTVATQTIGGVATTYTYNADGTVSTETRSGVTRTYTYNADGTLASVT